MFSRNERTQNSPSPTSTFSTVSPVHSTTSSYHVADMDTNSVIGKDLTIVGNAFSKGQIQVIGEFQGDIQCDSLVVGERAEITGNLFAKEIVISGKVKGTIRGDRVTLEQHSRIDGDIYHQTLAIQEGAIFAGRSYLTAAPKHDGLEITPD